MGCHPDVGAGRILIRMSGRRGLFGLPVVGAAFGGVVLGHWLGYLLAMPSAPARDQVLADTGHGYWLTAVRLAVVLAVVALGAVGWRQVQRARAGREPVHVGPGSLALRLGGLQILGFIALEVTERVAVGAPVSTLLAHHVLVLGVLVQVLVASCLALALWLFTRAAGVIARALTGARFPRPVSIHVRATWIAARRPALVTGSGGPRSPPSR
jgi:hypothetical protein